MAVMMTTGEASARWGISMRRINTLCQTGRIPGAYKEGKQWFLPVDAKKPKDKRVKDSHLPAPRKTNDSKKLPLPVGISDYKKVVSDHYYVDKTLLIRDCIDADHPITLFSRPHCFGKTLNMDMLRVFFEKTDEDTSIYFRRKKIWTCGRQYQSHQGKYPVIFITFKDVKCKDWESAYGMISNILRNECERHNELLDSVATSSNEKDYLAAIIGHEATEIDVVMSLLNLSRILHKHHGVAPIIIIDAYDVPIQQGCINGYYDQITGFFSKLFSSAFKDNSHISYGFLSGVLQISKESVFGDIIGLKVNTVLDNGYSEYFGFTPTEVRDMAAYYGAQSKYDSIIKWYGGYRFGDTDIVNPYSVSSFFANGFEVRAFWKDNSANEIIRKVWSTAVPENINRLETLMEGNSFVTYIDTSVVYPQIQKLPSSIFSYLLMTGYLNAAACEQPFDDNYMCEVTIPNQEVSYVYRAEVFSLLENMIPLATAISIQEEIYTADLPNLVEHLKGVFQQSINTYDANDTNYYHSLVLGLRAILDSQYNIKSKRENKDSHFFIQMIPLNKKYPGILIAINAAKPSNNEELKHLASSILNHNTLNQYRVDIRNKGVKSFVIIGVAVFDKNVEIASDIRNSGW